ncbi:MAG: glycosyltransferase family 39 protein, partial [Anaerolineae bacterium]|nr:glycosyltransferase family 39 protein [Anaerolineae bacterium]
MPLSFLIPGYIQAWFGPGLRVGRYFSIVLGILMLLGLWIVVRRLSGRWWAVLGVWAVSLNPALIKIYSKATSQVLIACMLAWVLVLALGKKQRLWQLILAVILAGAMIVTRINMAPVLPLLIIYIFWERGRVYGILNLFIGLITIVILHGFFWPGILKMWSNWLPYPLGHFINPLPGTFLHYFGSAKISMESRILSFWY